jgi:hypothetical protein
MLLQIAGLIVLGWLALAIIVTIVLVRVMRGRPKLESEPPIERVRQSG